MQWAMGMQFNYVKADPKGRAVLLKILDIYSFNNLAKIRK